MLKTAIISPCQLYRYTLGRCWNPNAPQYTIVMLNPSTADADKDDATIRRLINFCKEWGAGGFTVVNLFAYRTSNPDYLFQALADGYDIIGPKNDQYVKEALLNADVVVYAWGGNGHVLDRATTIAGWCPNNAFCIETSGHGFPKHPLYLKADSKLKLVHLDAKTKKFIIPETEHQRPLPARLQMVGGAMVVAAVN